MIKTTYKKFRYSKQSTFYVGRVQIFENGQYLYSHSPAIARTKKEDAIEDAKKLAATL